MREQSELLTVEELAEWLKIKTGTLYKWSSEGRGPRVLRAGSSLRYRVSDVEQWLDEQADGWG